MTARARILVVEDGAGEREALARLLRLEQFEVVTAENADQAMHYVQEPIDLVLSDLRMGASTGIDLLHYWADQRPKVPFILMTAYGEVESAVEAMKLGAMDYLTKPVDPRQLLGLIREGLDRRQSTRDAAPPPSPDQPGLARIIGVSPAMLFVFEQTRRAAQTESTVLVRGESGTGKELIAAAIHENSPRRGGPLVVVNMAAIPETLVESELFGHVKGSFTGATVDRAGCFEMANGGTIFIDEIGDFPPASQAKLLRVLENRMVTPVGGNECAAVNVRVVAATSRNLEQMVADGRFREDLYYRLHVVMITLPPLRERRADIPLLVDHFLRELCQANRLPPRTAAPDLQQYLQSHDWPGNVRQLRNCLESMIVMTPGATLTLDDLPPSFLEPGAATTNGAAPPIVTRRTLDDVERAAILRTLRQYGGNRTHAAEALGISVRTLQRRLREWQWQRQGPEPI